LQLDEVLFVFPYQVYFLALSKARPGCDQGVGLVLRCIWAP
jgi:hypothetical protein